MNIIFVLGGSVVLIIGTFLYLMCTKFKRMDESARQNKQPLESDEDVEMLNALKYFDRSGDGEYQLPDFSFREQETPHQ